MPSNPADDLRRRLRALRHTRENIEPLHARRQIARRDVERVYEGLYIAAVTSFEGFLEALFFDCVLNSSRYATVEPRAEFKSSKVLREVILSGRRYVNWLPYDRTEGRAEAYLRGGRPFSEADTTDKRLMNDWMTIRHAIAHTSREAERRFRNGVTAGIPLSPRQRSPAGFLRSQLRPQVSRLENVLSEMEGIATKLG